MALTGLQLSEAFYHEAVKPVLDAEFAGLPHSAALIGSGSEVLGYDDAMSTDHHWGPRLLLFLTPEDYDTHREALHETLRHRLPMRFRDYSTNFSAPNPDDNNTQLLQAIDSGPVNHRVEIFTIPGYLRDYLNIDSTPPDAITWLTMPQQKLLTLTAGAVYHDELGLETLRATFAFYPHDVWLYLLAATWTRIGQEEHLMGRAGLVGDEIGSALIGARLVRDLMRLSFLMARRYAPYPKWFGTAFARLEGAGELAPHLRGALAAAAWPEREAHLGHAYEICATRHNALGLTDPVPTTPRPFFGRPFRVIGGGDIAAALLERITDPQVRQIVAQTPLIGSVDLFSDNTDLLEAADFRPFLAGLYGSANQSV